MAHSLSPNAALVDRRNGLVWVLARSDVHRGYRQRGHMRTVAMASKLSTKLNGIQTTRQESHAKVIYIEDSRRQPELGGQAHKSPVIPNAHTAARSLITALNHRDVSAVLGLLAEDVTYENLGASTVLHGRAAVGRFYLEALAALPEDAVFVLEGTGEQDTDPWVGETAGPVLQAGLAWRVEINGLTVPLSRGLSVYCADPRTGRLARIWDNPEHAVKQPEPALTGASWATPLLQGLGPLVMPAAMTVTSFLGNLGPGAGEAAVGHPLPPAAAGAAGGSSSSSNSSSGGGGGSIAGGGDLAGSLMSALTSMMPFRAGPAASGSAAGTRGMGSGTGGNTVSSSSGAVASTASILPTTSRGAVFRDHTRSSHAVTAKSAAAATTAAAAAGAVARVSGVGAAVTSVGGGAAAGAATSKATATTNGSAMPSRASTVATAAVATTAAGASVTTASASRPTAVAVSASGAPVRMRPLPSPSSIPPGASVSVASSLVSTEEATTSASVPSTTLSSSAEPSPAASAASKPAAGAAGAVGAAMASDASAAAAAKPTKPAAVAVAGVLTEATAPSSAAKGGAAQSHEGLATKSTGATASNGQSSHGSSSSSNSSSSGSSSSDGGGTGSSGRNVVSFGSVDSGSDEERCGATARASLPFTPSTSLTVNLAGLWEKDLALSQVEEYESMLDVLELGGLQKVTARLIDGLNVKQDEQRFEVSFVTVVPFFRVTEKSRFDGSTTMMRRDLRSGRQTAVARRIPGGVQVEMSWEAPLAGSLREAYVVSEDGSAMAVTSSISIGPRSAVATLVYRRSSRNTSDFLASKRSSHGSLQDVLKSQEKKYGKIEY